MTNVEENTKCINFLIEKIDGHINPLLNMREIWREYKKVTSSNKSVQYIERRFVKCVAPKISGMELDYETKLKLIFATHTPADANFREEMKYFAERVELDHRGIIMSYKGDKLQLSVNNRPAQSRLEWNETPRVEEIEMLRFLAQRARETEGPLDMFLVWCQYKTHSKTKKEVHEIHEHFRENIAPSVYKLRQFDMDTKVRMLAAAQIPVSQQFFQVVKNRRGASNLRLQT